MRETASRGDNRKPAENVPDRELYNYPKSSYPVHLINGSYWEDSRSAIIRSNSSFN